MGALLLSRKKDEKIMIGDDITVFVADIQEGKVRLGIIAPRGVTIDREEVYLAKRADTAKGGGR